MSRLFGDLGNDAERLSCALHPVRGALDAAVHGPPDSWGLGFYQGGEVLLQRRPNVVDETVDFFTLTRELRTDVLLGHVRMATVGKKLKPDNTHPYRYRQWLFAHNGTVERFEHVRPALMALMARSSRPSDHATLGTRRDFENTETGFESWTPPARPTAPPPAHRTSPRPSARRSPRPGASWPRSR